MGKEEQEPTFISLSRLKKEPEIHDILTIIRDKNQPWNVRFTALQNYLSDWRSLYEKYGEDYWSDIDPDYSCIRNMFDVYEELVIALPRDKNLFKPVFEDLLKVIINEYKSIRDFRHLIESEQLKDILSEVEEKIGKVALLEIISTLDTETKDEVIEIIRTLVNGVEESWKADCYWYNTCLILESSDYIIETRAIFRRIRNNDPRKAEEFIESLIEDINFFEEYDDPKIKLLLNIGGLGGEKVIKTLEIYSAKNPEYNQNIQLKIAKLELFLQCKVLSDLDFVIESLIEVLAYLDHSDEKIKKFENRFLTINKLDKKTKLEVINLLEGIFLDILLVPLYELFKLETDKEVRTLIRKVHDELNRELFGKSFIEEEP